MVGGAWRQTTYSLQWRGVGETTVSVPGILLTLPRVMRHVQNVPVGKWA